MCGAKSTHRVHFLLAGLTSSQHSNNAQACGLEHSKTLELEVANVDGLTNAEVGDVDYELVEQVLLETRNSKFATENLEFTTGLNALRVTHDSHGNLDCNGLTCSYAIEIDVLAVVLNGVELGLTHNTLLDVAINVDLHDVGFGGVEEFLCLCSLNGEVDGLATVAIEHAGDEFLTTDVFCAFFAELLALNAFNLNSLHNKKCVEVNNVTWVTLSADYAILRTP